MTYYADPDVWRDRYCEACRAYSQGELRHAVFLATLYSLGFRGQVMSEESLARTERSRT